MFISLRATPTAAPERIRQTGSPGLTGIARRRKGKTTIESGSSKPGFSSRKSVIAMKKTIYLYRHGETDLNRNKIVQGSGMDEGLNETGRRQAQAFYEKYRNAGFDIVLTSALRRTHETVAPFLAMGLPWEQLPDINEVGWGMHEGKHSTPEMIMEYRDVIQRWQSGDLHASLKEGESAARMTARLIRFTEWLKARPEQSLLICSHGRAMRCLLCIMKGAPVTEMEIYRNENTALYKAFFDGRHFSFELESDLSHLEMN